MITKNKSGYITVNSSLIYYETINYQLINENKPILIFLHEGLGSCSQWKGFPSELSEELNLPVFMYDRYGYGKSDKITKPRTITYIEEEALDWLPKIINKLGLDFHKKILIGHSDGGSIALIYPAAEPKNLIGIITEAAHVFNEAKAYDSLMNIVNNYNTGSLKQKLKKYHGDNTDSMFLSWSNMWLGDNFRQWNIEHYLSKIKCPVLAIQGKEDEFGTYKQLESIKNNTKGKTELLFIDNCKHVPHQQAQEIVKKEMINFISGL
ncbi:MAG: alpha/beta hydrolase [Bacteroidales bacterium]|nr:alpha/beta hydrolase [Bacteroidales bacterium]